MYCFTAAIEYKNTCLARLSFLLELIPKIITRLTIEIVKIKTLLLGRVCVCADEQRDQ